jgi:hypothetical protein
MLLIECLSHQLPSLGLQRYHNRPGEGVHRRSKQIGGESAHLYDPSGCSLGIPAAETFNHLCVVSLGLRSSARTR